MPERKIAIFITFYIVFQITANIKSSITQNNKNTFSVIQTFGKNDIRKLYFNTTPFVKLHFLCRPLYWCLGSSHCRQQQESIAMETYVILPSTILWVTGFSSFLLCSLNINQISEL